MTSSVPEPQITATATESAPAASPSRSWFEPARGAFGRWGAALLGPRRYVATANPEEGQRDALLLGALYVVGTSIYPLADAAATLWATQNLGGALMFVSSFGRAVLAPVIVLVAVETILGRGRGHQRAIGLLPLVLVATGAHALRLLGVDTGLPPLAPAIAGGLVGAGLAVYVRPVVPVHIDEAQRAP